MSRAILENLMSEIDQSVIEAAWDEVTTLPETRVRVEMERLSREQPDLISFIFATSDGLGQRTSEFAGFVTFVLWRIFRSQTRGKLEPITSAAIQRKLEENEKSLMSLDNADQEIDEAAIRKLTPQPMIFVAVLAAMAAAEEEEEQPLVLSEDDKGALILLLKTAIDTLDDARNAAESKARLSS
jgi:hypothetical protein